MKPASLGLNIYGLPKTRTDLKNEEKIDLEMLDFFSRTFLQTERHAPLGAFSMKKQPLTELYVYFCFIFFLLSRGIYYLIPDYYSLSEKLVAALNHVIGKCGTEKIAVNDSKTMQYLFPSLVLMYLGRQQLNISHTHEGEVNHPHASDGHVPVS